MRAGLELFGPICGTRAGTVAACAIAIELPDVSAPRMQSAPFEMSFRAALTPPSGVVPSSAYSICRVTSFTPAWRSTREKPSPACSARVATTTRDRQVVAIAVAHTAGDADRVDALARDHLADHPDGVLVAWITANTHTQPPTRKDPS